MRHMSLAQASQKFEVGKANLKRWEREGVLSPDRDSNNFRIYPLEEVRKIALVNQYRGFGLQMVQIYALFTTKQGRAGLATKGACLAVLDELSRGEAELWREIEDVTAKEGAA